MQSLARIYPTLRAFPFALPSPPTLSTARYFSSSASRSRDLGAKYRRPPSVPGTVTPKVHAELPQAPTPPPILKRRDVPVVVAGVKVPPRPIPPGAEDCCMSGCVHCVLTIYAEDVVAYDEAVEQARQALARKGVAHDDWPEAVTESEVRPGETETALKPPPMDPSIAAFMALEAKLKKK